MAETFHYKVTIKETHIDSYGHVNNAAYLSLYEEARWELITPRGYGFYKIHEIKKGPVVLDVNLKFMKEIRLRETITITCEVVDYKGKVGHMKQQMIKEDGTIASEALFTFGLFDMQARKLIEATPEWMTAIGMGE
ncbi:acyl-CoA thioesterase [Bdellovibrio svalbardensis]|uniref:Acyl-CoA thioesterase n=1 Tax=Bdellovibrio svalbardensis TaxID=2972972 RepID=A0ABT6DFP8_9BACT|nr:acyl-CoA thioesterase [Bdellovibrio svalbardensis]MDG0815623.1 acyl-CoA thioesterase [Bdellovibrio svalbardensis]